VAVPARVTANPEAADAYRTKDIRTATVLSLMQTGGLSSMRVRGVGKPRSANCPCSTGVTSRSSTIQHVCSSRCAVRRRSLLLPLLFLSRAPDARAQLFTLPCSPDPRRRPCPCLRPTSTVATTTSTNTVHSMSRTTRGTTSPSPLPPARRQQP
jgi:hypothetical protein